MTAMKKHLSYIGTWLLASLMFASCSDFDDLFTPSDKDTVTLTLTMSGENLMTRATQIGDNTYNENTIDKIDIFLYPTGGTNQDAVYQKTITGINDHDTDGDKQHEVKTSIGSSDINALFPNGATECVAFVIVNRPDNVTLTDTDIESLKNLELTCTSFTTLQPVDPDEPEGYKKVSIPDNFVMSGQNNVTLNPQNRSITGEVEVYRSASKTTLEITNVVNKVQDENNPEVWWWSKPSDIRIYFKNCKEKGHLNNIELDNWSDGKKTLKPIGMQEIAGQAGHYTSSTPLYSYATNWAENINNRVTIVVVVPWAQGTETQEDTNFVETYYEIPINDAEERLDRNTYYKLALEIGVVGSLQEEQPLEILNCSYIILPWGTGHSDVDASLAAVRYLVVDEKEVVMNNVISYRINFSTSHPVEIVDMHLWRRDLTNDNADWNDQPISNDNKGGLRYVNGVPDYFRVPLKDDDTGTYMLIEHDLVNNMDKNSDYSDYRMTFVIRHKDNHDYSQTITVIQHPMVFADAEPNSNWGVGNNNDYKGYVYVNATQSESSSNFGGVVGLAGTNQNPNRYIIKATALTTDNYIIGDPRTRYVHNLNNTTLTSEQTAAANWANPAVTTDLETAQSWGRYTTTQVAQHYGTYNEWQNITNSNSSYREYSTIRENQAPYLGYYYSWDDYDSEQNAYGPVNNYYYWRVRSGGSWYNPTYTYYRTRYTIPAHNEYSTTLTYYHPTDVTNRTKKMIAPEFMVASSYGVTNPVNEENARKRCASYQEDGYPAGRWRLPTQAEVEYVCQLTAYGIIPMLFGSSSGWSTYWSANGYINVNPSQNQTNTLAANRQTNIYVRCVYDKWYWADDKCDKTSFSWGDRLDAEYWGQ